ncbi:MAG: hypothetical protein ACR2PJ_05400, partial [Pseudomonadales bacterium]
MKVLKIILIGFAILVASLVGLVFYKVNQLEVEQVTGDLHVIYGLGGNVAVLATSEGTVIVD